MQTQTSSLLLAAASAAFPAQSPKTYCCAPSTSALREWAASDTPIEYRFGAALACLQENNIHSRRASRDLLAILHGRGHLPSTLLLAKCCLFGIGGGTDIAEGARLIDMVLENNETSPDLRAHAKSLLADCHRMRIVPDWSHETAKVLYEEAGEAGVAAALYQLGMWYGSRDETTGWGTPNDFLLGPANGYFRRGAALGCIACASMMLLAPMITDMLKVSVTEKQFIWSPAQY